MAKLYFRYGAMNTGKSTILLQTAYNYQEKNLKCILIKPKIDTKGEDTIISRIEICQKVDILINHDESLLTNKYLDKIKKSNCVLVDESQFLSENQINELWYISKLLDIPVICYGIRTDFKSELFEGSKRLMELADEIEEIPTICKCGNKARFNARITNNEYVSSGDPIGIDNNKNIRYESLCGKCYIEKVKKYTFKQQKF